jgi:hypothetical protein
MPRIIDRTLTKKLNAGDERFQDALLFSPPWPTDTWSADLSMAFDMFTPVVQTIDDDDIPF